VYATFLFLVAFSTQPFSPTRLSLKILLKRPDKRSFHRTASEFLPEACPHENSEQRQKLIKVEIPIVIVMQPWKKR